MAGLQLGAADTSRRGAAAGAGTAAHRGAHRRPLSLRVDPRCTCAAGGGPTVGSPEDARHCDP